MRAIPLNLAQANELVTSMHRHHKKCTGHRFSIGAVKHNQLIGAAIVGRPVARRTDQNNIIEVTRLVTNGEKNVCSFLYAAAARIAKEMGFHSIQTFILDCETGVTLRAAGWQYAGTSKGGDWNKPSRGGRYKDDTVIRPKHKWVKVLNPPVEIAA